MAYRLLADIVILIHLGFTVFVLLGGVLVLRWPKTAILHIPAAVWGVWIEFSGGICPLTPLENRLRVRGGLDGYSESFVEHYLLPILYPLGLTRGTQIAIGIFVLAINLLFYGLLLRRILNARKDSPPDPRAPV
jgi:hypothetical protein